MGYQGYVVAFGDASWGLWFSGNVGLLLLGVAIIPCGLFISTRTQSQLVAAFCSFAIIMMFWMFDGLEQYARSIWKDFIGWFSLYMHFSNFGKGIVDSMDIWFCFCFGSFWMFMSWRTLLAVRWKGFERR